MAYGEIKMKKIILTLAALTLPAFASAEVPLSEFCPKIAQLSRSVMTARQAGAPMRQVMELAESDVTVSMVTEAYGYSAYSIQENKDRAIQDFEDTWYLRCVKSYDL